MVILITETSWKLSCGGGIDPRRSSNLFHGSRSCGSNLLPSEWLLLLASREGMYYTLFKKNRVSSFFVHFRWRKNKSMVFSKEIEVFPIFGKGGILHSSDKIVFIAAVPTTHHSRPPKALLETKHFINILDVSTMCRGWKCWEENP